MPCTYEGYEIPAITYTPASSTVGWICPKCSRVWSPWVNECAWCNALAVNASPGNTSAAAYTP